MRRSHIYIICITLLNSMREWESSLGTGVSSRNSYLPSGIDFPSSSTAQYTIHLCNIEATLRTHHSILYCAGHTEATLNIHLYMYIQTLTAISCYIFYVYINICDIVLREDKIDWISYKRIRKPFFIYLLLKVSDNKPKNARCPGSHSIAVVADDDK